MKILVISDSHGVVESVKKIENILFEFEYLFFCGDGLNDIKNIEKKYTGKILKVKGNCDSANIPEEIFITIDNKKFMITHGHNYNVNQGINNLYYKAIQEKIDCVVYGHTHVPKITNQNDINFFNAGSIAIPRCGSEKSVGIIEIFNNEVEFSWMKI